MTYCVGIFLDQGMIMLADTRTNAGVDNIATYSKMHSWDVPEERSITLMSAGNLAITQAVVNHLDMGLPNEQNPDEEPETLYSVNSMFDAAALVGRAIRLVHDRDAEAMEAQDTPFSASFLLGGQIIGRTMRLFQIYSAGNFISATEDTPFLQIGEHKYGKPILDRALDFKETNLMDGAKVALLSMDSTVRSNLSVGYPLDMSIYYRDEVAKTRHFRIAQNNPYMSGLSQQWSDSLRQAYQNLPSLDLESFS